MPALAAIQPAAHLLVGAVTLVALGLILRLVRRRQLRGKYALLWLAVGAVLVVLALVPNLLASLADLLDVFDPNALFLFVAVAFLFMVVVHFSWELSRLEDRSRILAEEVALLREELRRDRDGSLPPR